MIDFSRLSEYRENNQIEAKNAMGGLPKSIWETYSAFANTVGGIILLGVEELEDKSLRAVNLPEPEEMIIEFLQLLCNPKKVSVNILTEDSIEIKEIDGKRIIAITVPEAQPCDKPVYIDGTPLTGTYRRNGDGDYRCTKEEIQKMLKKIRENISQKPTAQKGGRFLLHLPKTSSKAPKKKKHIDFEKIKEYTPFNRIDIAVNLFSERS